MGCKPRCDGAVNACVISRRSIDYASKQCFIFFVFCFLFSFHCGNSPNKLAESIIRVAMSTIIVFETIDLVALSCSSIASCLKHGP